MCHEQWALAVIKLLRFFVLIQRQITWKWYNIQYSYTYNENGAVRWIIYDFLLKVVYDPSNGAIFNDRERPTVTKAPGWAVATEELTQR